MEYEAASTDIRSFINSGLKIKLFKTNPTDIREAAAAYETVIRQIPHRIIQEAIKNPELKIRISIMPQKRKPNNDTHNVRSNKQRPARRN